MFLGALEEGEGERVEGGEWTVEEEGGEGV